MWLKRLTQNELGSIARFNRSMSLLGAVPQREVPTYRAMTPAQLAATRRRRTVLILSAVTVFGSAVSIVTGFWLLMVIPATLLFSFFAIAWRAIKIQEVQTAPTARARLNISRSELAAKAREWNATPPVLPNRVVTESVSGLTGQQMLDLAAAQTAIPAPSDLEIESNEVDESLVIDDAPEQQSAAG